MGRIPATSSASSAPRWWPRQDDVGECTFEQESSPCLARSRLVRGSFDGACVARLRSRWRHPNSGQVIGACLGPRQGAGSSSERCLSSALPLCLQLEASRSAGCPLSAMDWEGHGADRGVVVWCVRRGASAASPDADLVSAVALGRGPRKRVLRGPILLDRP